MNQRIKFCKNWNGKLDQNVFTTMRNWGAQKESFYLGSLGKEFDVMLNEELHSKAVLMDCRTYHFDRIPLPLFTLDTGLFHLPEIRGLFLKFGMNEDDPLLIVLTFMNKCPGDGTGSCREVVG